jgi:biopolymer transport protein ExbD
MGKLVVFLCLIAVSCGLLTCRPVESLQEVIVVRVPPFFNPDLTPGQNYWLWQEFLWSPDNAVASPNGVIPDNGIPNDDSILYISLDENGEIAVNSKAVGNISDTKPLQYFLNDIFREREEAGVYEPGSWRVVKAVGIKVPKNTRYGDLIKVARTVKASGAEPIVLLLDGHLPQITFQL